jgi:uncharacterized damage-inducible protein DinB
MASKLLPSLFGYKSWANIELFEVVASAVPADHSTYRRSIVRTLNHIHIVDRIFRAHLLGERHDYVGTNTDATPDLDELRLAVGETDLWFEQYVATVDRSALAEPIKFRFTDGDRGQMTREEMLLHVITHGAWHRGEVGQILESHSIPSPPDSLTKFLHATQPSRREA